MQQRQYTYIPTSRKVTNLIIQLKIEEVPVDDSDEDDMDQASSVGAEENSLDHFTDEGSQLYID